MTGEGCEPRLAVALDKMAPHCDADSVRVTEQAQHYDAVRLGLSQSGAPPSLSK
jgi:hypothetical protein